MLCAWYVWSICVSDVRVSDVRDLCQYYDIMIVNDNKSVYKGIVRKRTGAQREFIYSFDRAPTWLRNNANDIQMISFNEFIIHLKKICFFTWSLTLSVWSFVCLSVCLSVCVSVCLASHLWRDKSTSNQMPTDVNTLYKSWWMQH